MPCWLLADGGEMSVVRIPIGRTAALLLLTAGGVLLGSAAWAAPPDVLSVFSPGDVVPGTWTVRVDDAPAPVFDDRCSGRGRAWSGADGLRFALVWQACAGTGATDFAKALAVTRVQVGRAWRDRSVLHGADVVQPLAGGIVSRSWAQSGYIVVLSCSGADADRCVDVTGRAAVYLSMRLPGRPDSSTGIPPATRIVASVLVAWALLVGGAMLRDRVLREPYRVDGSDLPAQSVDAAARTLRWRHRGRRWGQALLLTGLTVLVAQVVAAARTGTPSSWPAAVLCGVVAPVAGALLWRRCRHPMLGLGWEWTNRRVAPLRPRRVASVGLTMLLGLLALALPVGSVVGLFLVGLTSSEQDTSMLYAYGLLLALAAGWGIDRAAQRLRARNAGELIDVDRRDRYLYLRYFGDDDLKLTITGLGRRGPYQIATGWASVFRRSRFEEILARAVAAYGPVTAVDPPDKRLRRLLSALRTPLRAQRAFAATWVPKLGTAKQSLPFDTWLREVDDLSNGAHAVIMAAAPGHIRRGLRAEMALLAEGVGHGRVILVVSPHKTRAATVANFRRFIDEVAQYPMFAPLRGRPAPDGTLILVHVPDQGWGTWYGWAARYRTAWTYTAAVDQALAFANKAWNQAQAPADPFRGVPASDAVHAALSAAKRPGRLTGTGELLAALADADGHGRWDRLWLHAEPSGDPVTDLDSRAGGQVDGVRLTRAAERALAASARIARQYGTVPVPPAAVVLALIDMPKTTAGRRLGTGRPDQRDRLRAIVESDLLGMTLNEPASEPPPAPAGPRPVVGQKPLSLRYKIWSIVLSGFVGWGLIRIGQEQGRASAMVATCVALIIVSVVQYATAVSAGSQRYAKWSALAGGAAVLVLGAVAAVLS